MYVESLKEMKHDDIDIVDSFHDWLIRSQHTKWSSNLNYDIKPLILAF